MERDTSGKVPKPVGEDGCEPMCWHSMSHKFYEELIHSFSVRVVLDLTCLDGLFPVASILTKTPYIGVVFSEEHRQAMHSYLVNTVFAEMQSEGSPIYQAGLVEILKPSDDDDGTEKPESSAKKGQGRKRKSTTDEGGSVPTADPTKAKSGKADLMKRLKAMDGSAEPKDVDGESQDSADE